MKTKKVTLTIVLSMIILAFCVNAGICQDKGKSHAPQPKAVKSPLKGKLFT